MLKSIPPTSTADLNQAISTLRKNADRFLTLTIPERIDALVSLRVVGCGARRPEERSCRCVAGCHLGHLRRMQT